MTETAADRLRRLGEQYPGIGLNGLLHGSSLTVSVIRRTEPVAPSPENIALITAEGTRPVAPDADTHQP